MSEDSEQSQWLIDDIQSLLHDNSHAFSTEQLRGLLGANEKETKEALEVLVPGQSRNTASTEIRTVSNLFFHKRHRKPAPPPLPETETVRLAKFQTSGKNWKVHRRRLTLSPTVQSNIAAREGREKPHPLRVKKKTYREP